MPKLSPTMTEGKLVRWLKQEGDLVKEGDALCEIGTDKSTMEFTSIESGYIRKIYYREGSVVPLGKILVILSSDPNEEIPAEKEETAPVTEEGKKEEERPAAQTATMTTLPTFAPAPPRQGYHFEERGEVRASPLAKKIAKEKNLDLRSVKGTGPNGRVVAKDLEFAQGEGLVRVQEEAPEMPPGTYEEIPLTPVRKVIGERLQASKMTIPHYYITDEIRVDRMMALREELKEGGLKVTYNDFVIRATALALRKHPEVNAGFNSVNQTILQFKTVDISLAVSIPDGLITPILCHADYKDIFTLSEEAKRLAKKAKEGALKPEEYQGGSFTISNLGMFGIKSFDAVINPPQAAILAVGGIQEKPVVEEGRIIIGHTMHVTLSLDHRVIDGAEGAKFLNTLKQLLTSPSLLLV